MNVDPENPGYVFGSGKSRIPGLLVNFATILTIRLISLGTFADRQNEFTQI